MHVRTYDVGGGFGIKEQPYPEDVAILYAARALDRPVKWRGTRAEHFLSDNHARDALIDAELALAADGAFLAVRTTICDAMGAYFACHGPFISIRNTANGLPLVYRTPLFDITVNLVMTNTAAVGPYRGAGREQAALIMERLIDEAARETGTDPVELRRRNFIPPDWMPYTTPAGRVYDSGEFEAVMDDALALADWDGFAARRAASHAAGRLRGRGIACVMECVGAVPIEGADIRFRDDGRVDLVVAAQSQGQGHETSFVQVVADRLGIANALVDLRWGDSFDVPVGLATIGSRSAVMVGGAVAVTCDAVVAKGRSRRRTCSRRRSPTSSSPTAPSASPAPTARSRCSSWRGACAPPARCPTTCRRRSTRPTSSARPTSISPTAATSAKSRSTPTPARSRSTATARSTTVAACSTR